MITSLCHAARRLARARGFTAAAIVTLALGIGATTLVFSVVNAVLLRPLPYSNPDRLLALSHTLVVGGTLNVDQSDASILFYGRHNRSFSDFGGYQKSAVGIGPAGNADAERVPAGRITAGVLRALRVLPIGGRLFSDVDDRPGAAPVVLIGERLWVRKYGRDATLLNRRVDIDSVAHEVIGILPAHVRFPSSDTELWLPLRLDAGKTESATFDYQAIGRMRDGVSIDAAAADLQALLTRLPQEFPGRLTRAAIEQTHMRASVVPLADVIVGDVGRVLWVVLAAAGLVLAIACANVANLFLVRAESRREPLAIMRALGAAPRALFVESLGEGVLTSAIGGTLGVTAALAGIQVLRSALPARVDVPRVAELNVDATVLGLAALMTIFTAVVVSVVPALRTMFASRSSDLIAASRAATAGRDRHRMRRALVSAQVALALILLVGSGLMARSVWRLSSVRPGFDPAGAVSFRLALPQATYPAPDDVVRFFVRVEDRIRAIPGVEAAGVVSKLPLDDQGRTDTAVFVEDRPIAQGALPGIHPLSYVTAGYFAAAGIPFAAGRSFTRPDPPRVMLEAVVSRAFAKRYWNDESPIGKRVRILSGGPSYTIVGVVGSVRDTALDRPEDQTIYCPILPAREDPRWMPRDLAIVVRMAGDPAAAGVTTALRGAVRDLESSLPVYRTRLLSVVLAQASARRTFTFLLVGAASTVALLLGAIGLYGVLSYVVTLRAREMGVRLALGARPSEIRWLISRQGLSVAVRGIAIGLVGAVALTRFLSSLLFDVSPTDPAVLAVAAALLLLVAAAASWLPARRAAGIDPAVTLRTE